MAIYNFVNEIPEDLDPMKQYTTRVVDARLDNEGDWIIELEFLGEEYDPKNPQCLFPLTKEKGSDNGNG